MSRTAKRSKRSALADVSSASLANEKRAVRLRAGGSFQWKLRYGSGGFRRRFSSLGGGEKEGTQGAERADHDHRDHDALDPVVVGDDSEYRREDPAETRRKSHRDARGEAHVLREIGLAEHDEGGVGAVQGKAHDGEEREDPPDGGGKVNEREGGRHEKVAELAGAKEPEAVGEPPARERHEGSAKRQEGEERARKGFADPELVDAKERNEGEDARRGDASEKNDERKARKARPVVFAFRLGGQGVLRVRVLLDRDRGQALEHLRNGPE